MASGQPAPGGEHRPADRSCSRPWTCRLRPACGAWGN